MAITAAEEFFATLDRSNLLTPEQLADARRAAEESDDPTAIAKILIRQDLLTRWQAGQLLAGRSSFFLGKYKLIELLGRGGMGNVFLGEHTTMNRRVALKIVSRQVRKDPASLERFLSEARAIAALDHPNIVQAYSVDNEGDRYYIVMEYVDGINLQEIVEENGPLDYETAADCIRQAADGLSHGHGRNMIHCDVKPSNLLINEQGVVKIVDMGLSRLNGRDGDETNGQDDRVLGSVDYLAPEQALESADFDQRADIYSLGCTLYFLLTGRPPFPEGSLHERLMKHQAQQPQGILEQRPDAPRDLVDLCQQMMAKKAEDRPQSAEEIGRTLADWRPPAPKPKPSVPLKVAESLEKPAASLFSSMGLPSIDVNVKPKSTDVGVTKKKTSARKAGFFQAGFLQAGFLQTGFLRTPRGKIIAGAAALLAAGVVATATIPFLGGPGPEPNKDDQPRAESSSERNWQDKLREEELSPPDDEPPDDNTVSDEPPDDEPANKEPADDGPPDDKPANDEPMDDEPPPEEPADDEPPADDPPEDKPEPKEPEKKDPFRELAAAVELQLLDANAGSEEPPKAASLGRLHLAPDASWQIELLGGSNALKGKRQFDLKPGGDGKSWLVRLDSATAPGPAEVARIWHEENKLMFQWSEGAAADSANFLCNCALNVHVGGEKRRLRLSRTLQAEPLTVDFIKRVATSKISGKFLPDPGKLRLEITDWEGKFPPHRLEPQGPVTTKERINIYLDGKDRYGNVQPMMSFRLEWTVRGDQLTLTLRMLQPNARDFNFKMLQNEGYLSTARATYEQFENQLKKEKDAQKKMQLEAALNMGAGLIWYAQQYQALHQKGKIHFRIYAGREDGGPEEAQIELVNTRLGTEG